MFIEILRPNPSGGIVGIVYEHLKIMLPHLTDYVPALLKNLSKETKEVNLTEDFNVNLINFDKRRGTHQFLEELFYNNYTHQITLSTRITNRPATVIDNMITFL